jgi:hypothetical protein
LNGREVEESVGLDKIVGQLKPDDLKRMSGPIIIIKIGVSIDKGCRHLNGLTSLHGRVNATPSKIATQIYLDINRFSRWTQEIVGRKT